MLDPRHIRRLCSPVVDMRIPKSDMDRAREAAPPKSARSDQSRMYALFGAAILEKLCRSNGADVRSRRTVPYVLSTRVGRTALSVVVSAIRGSCEYKHMIIPENSLHLPGGVDRHILVCAFVSKRQHDREKDGGLRTRIAGWLDAADIPSLRVSDCRVNSALHVVAVPVTSLKPIQQLRPQIEAPNDYGKENADEKAMPGVRAEAPGSGGGARGGVP